MKRSFMAAIMTFLLLAGVSAACKPLATETPASPTLPTSHELPTAEPAVPVIAAFINLDRNLYTWAPDQAEFKQITSTGDAQQAYPSPDGTLIAFTRSTDYQSYSIDVVRVDGANHRTLFSQDQFMALPRVKGSVTSAPHELEWIPGTHLLTMNTYVILQGPGNSIGKDLMVINADDGTVKTLLSVSEGFSFEFSPDAKYIATSLADGVNLFDASGKNLAPDKFFGFPFVNTASEYQYMPHIQWSSDGSQFGFFIPPIEPFSENPGDTRVIVVKAADASFSTPVAAKMLYQWTQSINSDFSLLAYIIRTDPTSGSGDLHIAGMDGKDDQVYLTGKKVDKFFWSPDNRHFLYSYNDGTNFIANLGEVSTSPVTIPSITSMRNAAWVYTSHYLIVDKEPSGWKVWYGQMGANPVVVYSDSNSNDGFAYLAVSK